MKTSTLLSEASRQVLRFRRMIAVYYLATLAAAAAIVFPLAEFISSRLTHSFETHRLFGNLDAAWVVEMVFNYQTTPLRLVLLSALCVGGVFMLLNTFLAGGAIAVFHREDDTFFGASARFFLRFLRLLLISLVFYGVVLAINGAVNAGIDRLKEDSMVARPWAILHWVQLSIVFLLFGTVNMIFDYAKVWCVVENRRSALKATLAALRFVFANPGRTLSVYWTCAAFGLLFLLAYHGLSELIGQGSALTVVILFFVRQIYAVARVWTRLWTWSSEVHLYEAARPAPVAAPEPEPAPELPAVEPEPVITFEPPPEASGTTA